MRRKIPKYSKLFILFLLASCSSQVGRPNFVINKPECVIGSLPPFQNYAGIHFTIGNTATKIIHTISVSCMVYENIEGKNPFIGSNNVKAQFLGQIAPSETKKLIINLDPYLYTIPAKEYIIDFFYISSITYTDGSKWEDPLGIYSVRNY